MLVIEVFYKELDGAVVMGSVRPIRNGFKWLNCVPIFVCVSALWSRCALLATVATMVGLLFWSVDGPKMLLVPKLLLLFAFASIVPDIKRFELSRKGYISGGRFVAREENEAVAMFFAQRVGL